MSSVSRRTSFPVVSSHTRTVLSQLPDTTYRPSGVTATLVTASWCPVSLRTSYSERTTKCIVRSTRTPSTRKIPLTSKAGSHESRLAALICAFWSPLARPASACSDCYRSRSAAMFVSSDLLGKCAFGMGRSRPPAVYRSRGPVPAPKSSRSELDIFATSDPSVSDRGAAVGKYTSGMGHFRDQKFTGRLGSVLLPKGPRWNAAFPRRAS
jgi:hypothetical protein